MLGHSAMSDSLLHRLCVGCQVQQSNKSRDKLLGQGTVTLFGKPTDQEDVRLVSQGTILPELDFRILLN